MALKLLNPNAHKMARNAHSVRFTSEDLPKYKSMDATECSLPNYAGCQSYGGEDSGAPSPDGCHFQPAAQRFRFNEQRPKPAIPNSESNEMKQWSLYKVKQGIKLLTSINQVVQQRAELESSRSTLTSLLEDLRRKLKRRVEDCYYEKKEKLKALKQANLRLEKEKFGIFSEMEHLQRHLEREESHHTQHARNAVAQAIQGVVKNGVSDVYMPCSIGELPAVVSRNVARNAPSRVADNKLAAARLMRDIAELRQRVGQIEARLSNELKRKRQAEQDIVRLRKELSASKSSMASLRLPPAYCRKQCSKFA